MLKLICINLKSMTVSVSVSDNSSHLEDGQLTAPVMSGVCCQTVRRQTGTKTPGHALGACLCERSRRAKGNYIQFGNMYLLFIWILGSLCSVNASRSMSRPMGRDRNLGPLPGPVYWLLV